MTTHEINELYQDIILEHNHSPLNYYKIVGPTHKAKGSNPFCGDKFEVFCVINNNIITEISFVGQGCAISKASASIMMQIIEGKDVSEALQVFHNFHNFLLNKQNNLSMLKDLKILLIFQGVKNFPLRVKCATLAWHTFKNAIRKLK